MKNGLYSHVFIRTPAVCRNMEERPYVQDEKVSAVWQEVFSFGAQVSGILPLRASVANCDRAGVGATGSEPSKFQAASQHRRSRQAISNFLTQANWNARELLQHTAVEQLQRLGYQSGESLYLVLDDTQKQKRCKQMAAVSKIFLHAEKIYANGHTILGAALVYRGVVLPCAVKLWASGESCRQSQSEADPIDRINFRTLTWLFDSYYLCHEVAQTCDDRGWKYVGVAKKNRNFFPDGRPRDRRKLGSYGRDVLRRDGRSESVRGKPHRLAERVGQLKHLGPVKWSSAAARATRRGCA